MIDVPQNETKPNQTFDKRIGIFGLVIANLQFANLDIKFFSIICCSYSFQFLIFLKKQITLKNNKKKNNKKFTMNTFI